MFDADRPITSSTQDRLGRSIFAKYLAHCILDHNAPESLVVGLYGTWGTGKTSLINLVIEELNYASTYLFDDDQPIILNFSPWSYSGQAHLSYNFFKRLAAEIRRAPFLKNKKQLAHLLELYISFFNQNNSEKSFSFKKEGWASGLDPISIKSQINQILKEQNHKIIIIIDNISRLEPIEVNQILQIVKSMGDYVNTIYLLALDKNHAIHAINKVHGGEGNEYLEKLVQLAFDVPIIAKQDLENLLFDKLEKLLPFVPPDSWDTNYWGELYYSSLKYFFNNCRDITRYINALSFSYPRVKEVVNPMDFFALTAIEIFTPRVYFGISANKDLFTDMMNTVYEFDEHILNRDKDRCDEILLRSEVIPQAILKKLLLQLFPRLRTLYEPDVIYYYSKTIARQNKRVCTPDLFDIYFRLSIATGDITHNELKTILSFLEDEDTFDQALQRINHDHRIPKFLDLLDSEALTAISYEHHQHLINALFDSTDLFEPLKENPFAFSTEMRVHRICHQLLRMYGTTHERYQLLHEAMSKATKSLYISVFELQQQTQEHSEQEDTFLPLEHRDLNPEELDALKKIVVEKISIWAENGRLAEHPKLLMILFAWKDWDVESSCQCYLEKIIQDEKGLIAFLSAALATPIAETQKNLKKNPEWHKSLENISELIPIATVEPYAKTLFEKDNFETLRETEQLAILIFLDLIDAKTIKVIPKTTV